MKQEINEYQFQQAFKQAGRGDQFSYHGLIVLYNWLEEIDGDYDLDVVELCGDYNEYDNLEELQKNYKDIESMEDLEARTVVLMIDNDSFIIQPF